MYVGADTVGERISAVVRAATDSRSIVYVYEGELDATGHRRGCRSWAWEHQLAMVDSSRHGCGRRCRTAPGWS